jgi:hypothetical protein
MTTLALFPGFLTRLLIRAGLRHWLSEPQQALVVSLLYVALEALCSLGSGGLLALREAQLLPTGWLQPLSLVWLLLRMAILALGHAWLFWGSTRVLLREWQRPAGLFGAGRAVLLLNLLLHLRAAWVLLLLLLVLLLLTDSGEPLLRF